MTDREGHQAGEQIEPAGTGSNLEMGERQDYINAEDIFYWMEDREDADVPLCALGIHIPLGCRFCI